MPIASFDAAAAGQGQVFDWAKVLSGALVVGRPVSQWAFGGNPVIGSWNNTLNGVVCTGATVGAYPRTNPTSGNQYVYRATAHPSAVAQAGRLLICDRIWHNGGISATITTAQAIAAAPVWPARCPTSQIDPTPATTGVGVRLGVEVEVATGAGTPTITVGYNNVALAARTATNAVPTVATSAVGTFYPIGLAGGDTGVRAPTSFQLSATWTAGTIHLVAYRVLAEINIRANEPGEINWLTGGGQRIYDNSCLFSLFYPSATTTTGLSGSLVETNGA